MRSETTPLKNLLDTRPLDPTALRPMWLKLTPEDATLGDVLCEFLVKRRVVYAVVVAIALHGILFVSELLISWQLRSQGVNTLTYFDQEEYLSATPSYFFYGPLIWWFYSWQPRMISIVCNRLWIEGFIGSLRREPLTMTVFAPTNWRRRIMTTAIMLLLLCIGTYLYAWRYTPPCGIGFANCFGKPDSWLTRTDWFLKWFWTPVFALNLVLLVMILFRQAGIVWSFARLFKSYNLVPKLFHPDECSGLGFVGGFFISTAWFVVVGSAWLIFVIFYPSFYGRPINFPPYNLFYVSGTSIGLPFFSLLPMAFVHNAMYRARQDHLLALKGKMTTTIPTTPDQLAEAVARLDIFAHIEKAHVLVPFPKRRIVLFLLTALFPPIFAAVALVVQVLQTAASLAPHGSP